MPRSARTASQDVVVARHRGRDLMLDLVLPAAPGPHPVVAWLHGGAFMRGDRKRLPADITALTSRGIALASLEYRLSHEAPFPAQLRDVRAALRHLHHHGAELGLDSGSIGVWGASAGGHLAALAGLMAHVPALPGEPDGPAVPIRAVATAYPLTDLTDGAPRPSVTIPALGGASPEELLLGGRPADLPELARAASPLLQVAGPAPPFQICCGDADLLVNPQHSIRLHERLLAAGNDSELITVTGFGHAFLNPADENDVDTAGLHDAGRLIAEQPARAVRNAGRGDAEVLFDFASVADFFGAHLQSSGPSGSDPARTDE
ncbi:alpha/beta hydrolase [Saccharopolyspora sp. NPDC049357]|uniref:alpha/beta hydrolase n=1 Tax=Saccharopolyspora sp. NPDC049357 TaxID=3154507 RepID=UPI003414B256